MFSTPINNRNKIPLPSFSPLFCPNDEITYASNVSQSNCTVDSAPSCVNVETPQLSSLTNIHSNTSTFGNDKGAEILQQIKRKHVKNITIGYLNINSIRNKIDDLRVIINGNVDILIIAETKLDESFPTAQFLMEGYNKPLRQDVSSTSGGLLVYVKKGIAARPCKTRISNDKVQIISITLHLKNSKWLLISLYRPEHMDAAELLESIEDIISCAGPHSNVIIIGDFNIKENDPKLMQLKQDHDLYNLIKDPTCFKSKENPSAIDHIFTNKKFSFIESCTIETGLSDYHKMIFTCMKSTYTKIPPKIISYRDYKNFDKESFLCEINESLREIPIISYKSINTISEVVLEKYAPVKSKVLRGNEKMHMNKELRKAIMVRSKLKNVADTTNDPIDILRYKKQRNICVHLNRKSKREAMSKINVNRVENARTFWKVYKPFLSKKFTSDDKIILVEKEKIISDDCEIANTFNDYYTNVTKSLNIFTWPSDKTGPMSVNAAISKYESHPSILMIKERHKHKSFSFTHVLPEDVKMEINKLKTSKKSRGKIPVNIIKILTEVNLYHLTDCINSCISEGKFPEDLKLGDITVAFKADDSTSKECYRPISILEAYSKVYERLLCKQINAFTKDILSVKMCAYREGHSTQHLLLKLIDRWRKCLDKSGVVGTILMDLSKAFDSLPHDLLIAKLEAYGFSAKSLDLMFSYLNGRYQRVKIGSAFSKWLLVIAGIPQGSVLGPILFNIFINDIFYLLPDIFNFADDNTIDACCDSIELTVKSLECDLKIALQWFEHNSLIANPKKFQLMFLGLKNEENYCLSVPSTNDIGSKLKVYNDSSFQFGSNIIIKSVKSVKLLGVVIDNKLTFNTHIDSICSKAKSSISALQRVSSFTEVSNLKILVDTYFLSCFSYCPVIWMFCSKTKNKKINALHKKALKLVTHGTNNFDELLKVNKTTDIHTQNIHSLLVEVFHCIHKLNPSFLWEEITVNENYTSKRHGMQLVLPKTKKAGAMKTLSFRGSILWNYLPKKYKYLNLVNFKSEIRALKELLTN